jgi:ribosomal-protein-serine acetyltransferase
MGGRRGLRGNAAVIRLTRRQVADNDGFQTAIVCDGRIVGAVGFHGIDWDNRSSSIGYWLDAGHQGRGIMTSAVRALVDHALRGWELNRVEIRAAPDNRRSRAIPERLGIPPGRRAEGGRTGRRPLSRRRRIRDARIGVATHPDGEP